MNLGRVSSAALMLSGVAGVVTPTKVASALDLSAASGRAVAEGQIVVRNLVPLQQTLKKIRPI